MLWALINLKILLYTSNNEYKNIYIFYSSSGFRPPCGNGGGGTFGIAGSFAE